MLSDDDLIAIWRRVCSQKIQAELPPVFLMRAVAAAAVGAGLEEAAKVCDELADQFVGPSAARGASKCAKTIRARIGQNSEPCEKCHDTGFVTRAVGQAHCECNPLLPVCSGNEVNDGAE